MGLVDTLVAIAMLGAVLVIVIGVLNRETRSRIRDAIREFREEFEKLEKEDGGALSDANGEKLVKEVDRRGHEMGQRAVRDFAKKSPGNLKAILLVLLILILGVIYFFIRMLSVFF